MWSFEINTHSKKPNYIIRAKITFSGSTNLEEFYNKLGELRVKLEKTIPGSFKPKYTVGMDGLNLLITSKNIRENHRIMYQLEDFIKSAIIAVK